MSQPEQEGKTAARQTTTAAAGQTTGSARAGLQPPAFPGGDDGAKPKFVNKGYSASGELGELSAKYESNGNPGTVSTGRGDSGGVSYGSYQLASAFGNPEKFLNSTHGSKYKAEFGGHKSGTAAFSRVWRQIASREPAAFQAAQHAYIQEKYYNKFRDKVKSELGLDIDARSRVLQDVAWSTAVQHGERTDVFTAALRGKDPNQLSDEEIIMAVYAERGRPGPNGTLARFSKNSMRVQRGVKSRFIAEQNNALNALFPDGERKLTGVVGGKSASARDTGLVQSWLVQLGYLTEADIRSDSQNADNPKTKSAIIKFQTDNQSVLGTPDGYVGMDSERMLISMVNAKNKPTSSGGGGASSGPASSGPTKQAGNPAPKPPAKQSTNLVMLFHVFALQNAMKGWGTDEKTVYKVLAEYKGDNQKINQLKQLYKERTGLDLVEQIHSEFSNGLLNGNELDQVLALIAITEKPKTATPVPTQPEADNPAPTQTKTATPVSQQPQNRQSISGSVGEGGVNRKADVVLIQKLLNNAGAGLVVDGDCGRKTKGAIRRYQSNFLRRPDGRVDPGGTTFRHLVAGVHKVGAAPTNSGGSQHEKPTEDLSAEDRPYYSGIRAVYGEPGEPARRQLVNVSVPFKMYYGNSPVSTIRIHKKVAKSFEAALKEVLGHYGEQRIHDLRIGHGYAGSYNNRSMRGGKKTSTHAWGIAVDFNAAQNQLRWGSDRALFAKPEYKPFLEIMEKHGWYNLGRHKNYDYMHFQAVKI